MAGGQTGAARGTPGLGDGGDKKSEACLNDHLEGAAQNVHVPHRTSQIRCPRSTRKGLKKTRPPTERRGRTPCGFYFSEPYCTFIARLGRRQRTAGRQVPSRNDCRGERAGAMMHVQCTLCSTCDDSSYLFITPLFTFRLCLLGPCPAPGALVPRQAPHLGLPRLVCTARRAPHLRPWNLWILAMSVRASQDTPRQMSDPVGQRLLGG